MAAEGSGEMSGGGLFYSLRKHEVPCRGSRFDNWATAAPDVPLNRVVNGRFISASVQIEIITVAEQPAIVVCFTEKISFR